MRPPGGRAGKNGRGKRENERQSDRKGRPAEMPRSARTPGKPTCSKYEDIEYPENVISYSQRKAYKKKLLKQQIGRAHV